MEEALEQIASRLPADQATRLRRDVARHDLACEVLAVVAVTPWQVDQVAVALTADPLDDARSIARVLRRRLVNVGQPPERHEHDVDATADADCPDCAGHGVVQVRRIDAHGRPEVCAVTCRCVEEPAA